MKVLAAISPAVPGEAFAENYGEQTMIRIIVAAAVAVSFASFDTADAAKRKRHKVRHLAPVAAVPAPAYRARTPGPIWAGPGECYTDEGYGRYTACGSGRDSGSP